ncbi:hypothetical protein ES703_44508 [subsurface metagenome]
MEGNNLIKKGVVVAVILLFISVSVIPSTGTTVVKKSTMPTFYDGNTLYVGGSGPNNYTKIQDAIDNASDGDTVIVYDDSSPYYENVVVNVSVNLIGEDKNTTIIDGKNMDNVITINHENTWIEGFSIRNSGDDSYLTNAGINIFSNNNTIKNCNFYNNYWEIWIQRYISNNNTVKNNNFHENTYGILILGKEHKIINN